MTKCSIICTSHDRPKFLKEAVDSIFAQTLPEWQLIIVDSSTDVRVKAILDEAKKDERVLVLTEPRNVGVGNQGNLAQAWNRALDHVKGEYIAFLDDDNRKKIEFCKRLSEYLDAHPEHDAACCFSESLDEEGNVTPPRRYPLGMTKETILFGNYVDSGELMMRSSVIDLVGDFDERLRTVEDWDMVIRILYETKGLGILEEILTQYRFHPGRRTSKALKVHEQDSKLVQSKRHGGIFKVAVVSPDEKNLTCSQRQVCLGMEKVSILIPTRQRYKKLKKCLELIFEKTKYPNWEAVVILDRDDPESLMLVNEFEMSHTKEIKTIIKDKREMYVGKINEGCHKTDSPLIGFLADDVEVQKNWLTEAIKTFNEAFPDGIGLVSFQDEFDDKLAPHGLISRKYVEEFLNGNIFYPGYVHYWCDAELTTRSKRWGRFAHSYDSLVFHSKPEKVEDRDHISKEGLKTREDGEKYFIFRLATGFPDRMPKRHHWKLPERVVVRFGPTEEMYFYFGFGVDTRKKLDWEVDSKTASFLLGNFPMWFTTPILEKHMEMLAGEKC